MVVYEHLGLPTGCHEAQSADKSPKDKLQNKNKWLIDRDIRRIGKKFLNLPQTTSAESSTSVTKRDA